jgi:hypothetical protein
MAQFAIVTQFELPLSFRMSMNEPLIRYMRAFIVYEKSTELRYCSEELTTSHCAWLAARPPPIQVTFVCGRVDAINV